MTTLRIGSRKSALALWQTNRVADLLREAHDDLEVEIVGMDTTGDRVRDEPLPKIGAKGLFTKELEEALLGDEVDLAVHSLKDLPSELPQGLRYAGSPDRAAPTDALIAPDAASLEELPAGAVIATGSVRRRAQLAATRSDLQFENLRGNVDTRIRKLEEFGWHGIIMATAALHRMGRNDLISCELVGQHFVPAASQGAIGIETREGRDDVDRLLAPILDAETTTACSAERHFLHRLEGGCSVALGVHCQRTHRGWNLRGWVGAQAGTETLHDERTTTEDPIALADAMADDFISDGAREVLGR